MTEHDHHEHDDHDHGEHEHVHTFDWQAEVEGMREGAKHYYEHQFDWRGHEPPPGWDGPHYYDLSMDWRLLAHLDRHAQGAGDQVKLATSTGLVRDMVQIGDLTFEVADAEHRLTAFLTRDHEGYELLFVPFRDGTSGKETYGAGRYLDIPFEDGEEEIELDFNLAYNPSCAYSPTYDCPFPPAQNWLSIDVPAGERLPYDEVH